MPTPSPPSSGRRLGLAVATSAALGDGRHLCSRVVREGCGLCSIWPGQRGFGLYAPCVWFCDVRNQAGGGQEERRVWTEESRRETGGR